MLYKLFNELNLTYKKVIIFAIIIGIYTGLICILFPIYENSITDITVSFEWWILFAIIIISNSSNNKDSMLKVFIFFLISQPLIYLVQVTFQGITIF